MAISAESVSNSVVATKDCWINLNLQPLKDHSGTVMQIVSSRMHFLWCLSCNIFLNLDERGKILDMVYNVSEFALS